mmetsp:Transcript_25751/g.55416  ORF Transcript_25751/g.55416 Transcript_25751/m.55416 type:complete len:208 (+) Transcript_25751:313-936(+)
MLRGSGNVDCSRSTRIVAGTGSILLSTILRRLLHQGLGNPIGKMMDMFPCLSRTIVYPDIIHQHIHISVRVVATRRHGRLLPKSDSAIIGNILPKSFQHIRLGGGIVLEPHVRHKVKFHPVHQTYGRRVETTVHPSVDETGSVGMTRPFFLPWNFCMFDQVRLERGSVACDANEELPHERVSGEQYASGSLVLRCTIKCCLDRVYML